MLEISKAFPPSSETVKDFFHRAGVGYYIPLYQREYSWDRENIDQLMEDICRGVDSTLNDEESIRFMGTLILLTEQNPQTNVEPKDARALPPRIDNVIDGQQRISTFSLLACLLYQRLVEKKAKLSPDGIFDGLREEIDTKIKRLQELFSVDITRGKPERKPIIIRGSEDCWSFDGKEDDYYKSKTSLVLAKYIKAISEGTAFPKPPADTAVGKNMKRIAYWLNKVENPNKDNEGVFPKAWDILNNIKQESIWSYERPELYKFIEDRSEPLTKDEKNSAEIIQLFSFVHFFLDRCCFNIISPIRESWAFDMFQSLNASGTPLTALETFKPLVVNVMNNGAVGYKNSTSDLSFQKVDQLMSTMTTAATKNKLTNEFLTTFALVCSGSKLSTQFSAQRKWLVDSYDGFESTDKKEEFINWIGDLAEYWNNVVNVDVNNQMAIFGTEEADADLRDHGYFCALFLRDSGHKMANTILSRFYSKLINASDKDKKIAAANEFLMVCKAIAAFFVLWRSCFGNSGLDDVYRRILRGDEEANIVSMSYTGKDEDLTADKLKTYLKAVLEEKGLLEPSKWVGKAKDHFKYNHARVVCKFALFITAHDTINDTNSPGLMKVAAKGTCPYLEPKKWISSDFKSIEHIAPRNPETDSEWDDKLYKEEDFEKIGNLTLLPVEINSSAGNKKWLHKLIYYRHLSEVDPENLKQLETEAKDSGFELSADTTELLKKSSHKHHIKPIVTSGTTFIWNLDVVEKRTKRICQITWDRISPWLD